MTHPCKPFPRPWPASALGLPCDDASPGRECGRAGREERMDELGRMQGGPAAGTTGGGAGGDIAGAIGGLVGGQGGLQDVAQSWVGTGGNQSVDPDRLGAALGPDRVNQLSQQSGLSIPQLLPMLAGALPAILHPLTPDGR